MDTALFTGLDLHKRSITATTLDQAGNTVAHAKLPARPDALLLYLADCGASASSHQATVEATTGWYWVSDTLASTDVTLRLAHAKGVKAIVSAKVKTDSADARMLAQLLRTNLLPEAHMIEPDIRPLRDVLRTRLSLVERSSAAKNSVSRLIEKMNVKDVTDLPELMQGPAECHLEQIEVLQQQIKRLEKSLHPHLVPDTIVQRLLRIPGIGKAGAFTIRLEVDTIDRFADERSFFSYCRLVPGANNSGDRVKHKRSREGNRYLKMTFGNAAVRAVQYYPEIRSWYLRKKRRKGERIAKALVAKEIARIVFYVCKNDEDFNGRFKGSVLERVKQEWMTGHPCGPCSEARTV